MTARPSTLVLGLRTLRGRAYPRVVGLQREPSWIAFETVLPLLAVSALVLVYRGLGADPRFEGYVILGGAMTAFWLNVVWMMAMQLRWEKEIGNLDIFTASPTNLMWILAGMAIGGGVATATRAAMIIGFGTWVFDVPFTWSNAHWGFLVLLVTIGALYGVGMVAAAPFLKFGRGVEKAIETLQEPVYVLTGTFFPIRSAGMGLALAGAVVPMTLGLDSLRQLLLPGDANPLLPWWVEGLLLVPYAILMMLIARAFLARMERRAKEDGRLSLRWQ